MIFYEVPIANPLIHLVIDPAFFGQTSFDSGGGGAVKENLGGGVLLTPSNPDRF